MKVHILNNGLGRTVAISEMHIQNQVPRTIHFRLFIRSYQTIPPSFIFDSRDDFVAGLTIYDVY